MDTSTRGEDCPERGLMDRIRSGRLNGLEREGLAALVGAIAVAQRTIAVGGLPPARQLAAWLPVAEQFAVLLPAFGPRLGQQR